MKSIAYNYSKIRTLLMLFLLFAGFSVSAQIASEALKFTQFSPLGTSRFTAMGGAFGALGADLSVMATNPAGTGLYRKSDVGISTAWTNNNVQTTYYGNRLENTEFSFQLANTGFVVVNPIENNSGWKNVNVGFAYNHLNDYNSAFIVRGTNPTSSLLDDQANLINQGYSEADRNAYYDADVVFFDSASNAFTNDYLYPGAMQNHTVITDGYAGEYDFNFSSNYNDILFVGGTFSFQQIRYRQTTYHSEVPVNDIVLVDFNSADYLEARGNGFSFKMGMLLKIGQMLRLGAAFHTPINYNFRYEYWTDVNAHIKYPDPLVSSPTYGNSPWSEYNWELRSPAKYMLSSAVVLGNYAIISAEAEYLDYANMDLRADDFLFEEENRSIQNTYHGTANLRLGAEFKVSVVSLRAGAGYLGSPYASGERNSDAHKYLISGGLGFNMGTLYFDAAYQYVTGNEYYYMYGYSDSEVRLKNQSHKFMASLGYRF